MSRNFETLKRDFDSCDRPLPYDPMTIKTLSRIFDEIKSGETTLAEFEDYLTNNKMGRTPANERKSQRFGDACYGFVTNVLNFLEANQS